MTTGSDHKIDAAMLMAPERWTDSGRFTRRLVTRVGYTPGGARSAITWMVRAGVLERRGAMRKRQVRLVPMPDRAGVA